MFSTLKYCHISTIPRTYHNAHVLYLGKSFDNTNDILHSGIKMELDDCSYGELHSVTVTTCVKNAAANADYIVILDPLNNTTNPDRFQLLKEASLLYRDIANAIKGVVKPDAKVSQLYTAWWEIILFLRYHDCVVSWNEAACLLHITFGCQWFRLTDWLSQIVINGYKACLGGMLLKHHGVTSDNISVVVTLDEQRMRAKLAKKLMVITGLILMNVHPLTPLSWTKQNNSEYLIFVTTKR